MLPRETDLMQGNGLEPIPENFPQELTALRQWVLWRLEPTREGRITKVPYGRRGKASSTNPAHWLSFEEALGCLQTGAYKGLGFVFTKEDPFTGIDFDALSPEIEGALQSLNSYTEKSVSGRGVHVIVRARKSFSNCRKEPFEIYDSGRFFVMTGHLVEGFPATIEARQFELEALEKELFREPRQPVNGELQDSGSFLGDTRVIDLARKSVKQGAKFRQLFENGDTSGFASDSEADLSLCRLIAFYTKDEDQIDRIFRQSKLCREKWERDDYREGTISRALESCAESYSGKTDNSNRQPATPTKETQPDEIFSKIVPADHLLSERIPEPDQILFNTFDVGDKVAVFGPAKMRKSFFLLQLALCLSRGKDFLYWYTPKARRVLLIQLEIKAEHFSRRLQGMAGGHSLFDLWILNGRGLGVDISKISDYALKIGAEVIIFDPLYKLLDGDENSAQDVKPLLAQFDAICENTGAALIYCHHDAKGVPGARDIRDRGAGSNVLARDYDAAFTLTASDIDSSSIVVEALLRNYPPQPIRTIQWEGSQFEISDSPPIPKSGKKSEMASIPLEAYYSEALKLAENEILLSVYRERLQNLPGINRDRQRALIEALEEEERIEIIRGNKKRGEKDRVRVVEPAENSNFANLQNCECENANL